MQAATLKARFIVTLTSALLVIVCEETLGVYGRVETSEAPAEFSQ